MQESQWFVAHITVLSEFDFILTDFDLKIIIKDYLSAQMYHSLKIMFQVIDWL